MSRATVMLTLLWIRDCTKNFFQSGKPTSSNGHTPAIVETLRIELLNGLMGPASGSLITVISKSGEKIMRRVFSGFQPILALRPSSEKTAHRGHESIIRILLDFGVKDLNSRYKSGHTPLLHAESMWHTKIVKLLLRTGIPDPNCQNAGAHETIMGGHRWPLPVKQTGKMDSSLEDQVGFTLLTYATEYGNEHIIKLLLDASDPRAAKTATTELEIFAATRATPELQPVHEGPVVEATPSELVSRTSPKDIVRLRWRNNPALNPQH
ncbi:ankyrin [Aspergillus welwitschiae]|uniref:Ankyrin n=1 Tax=Aspergillus welwitschiae TaxID=1341132 RepID=A0A3F3QH23_9EURO|nr:ankyrin [Aspergillus welwitschiae]RDH37946.1 ankyrin [Aspergillus welwitschiae]